MMIVYAFEMNKCHWQKKRAPSYVGPTTHTFKCRRCWNLCVVAFTWDQVVKPIIKLMDFIASSRSSSAGHNCLAMHRQRECEYVGRNMLCSKRAHLTKLTWLTNKWLVYMYNGNIFPILFCFSFLQTFIWPTIRSHQKSRVLIAGMHHIR